MLASRLKFPPKLENVCSPTTLEIIHYTLSVFITHYHNAYTYIDYTLKITTLMDGNLTYKIHDSSDPN